MAEESVRVLKAVVCSQVGVRTRSGKARSKPEAVGRENQRGGAIRSSRRAAGRLARERILMVRASDHCTVYLLLSLWGNGDRFELIN